jgi:drug/metabolite transporter (DMT)-like permease
MSRALKAHVLLVVVTFIWGSTFVLIKSAVATDASPLFFNFVRMTLASAALAAIFWRDVRKIDRKALWFAGRVGFFLFLGYEFQTPGLRLTTPSKSAFITGMSVVLVPVLLVIFWRRKLNLYTVLGVLAAFFGMFLMTVPAGAAGSADWQSVNRGDLLTFACAVSFALQIIFMGEATKRVPFPQIAFLQTAVSAVLMGVAAPLVETPHLRWTATVSLAIVITGLLGTAAAFSIQAWAQQFTSPTHTALIFALEPVFAWLTSYLLGERLGLRASVGAFLILAGVLTSELLGTQQEAVSSE